MLPFVDYFIHRKNKAVAISLCTKGGKSELGSLPEGISTVEKMTGVNLSVFEVFCVPIATFNSNMS